MQGSLPDPENPTDKLGCLDRRPRFIVAGMVVLLVLAGAIRLYRLNAPGLLIDRDYMSAIYARSFYFEHTDSVDEWRKEIAYNTRLNQPIREPPVTEFLVSLLYRAASGEHLWLARLLTSSLWLVGGVPLYKIIKRTVSTEAALLGTAYYMFVPLSITLSRSFQPDALMMLLFLISLLGVISYYEKPSGVRLVIAACLSGLTLLCRPFVVFPLLGAFTALAVLGRGWKRVIDKRFLLFLSISLIPPLLYYGYGIVFASFLRSQAEMSFRPYLLLRREFWLGWMHLAGRAVGYAAAIGAMLGAMMLRKGLPRALVVGLGIGYIVFGLVFTQHIHTHGYYQAVLIPIVAISLGPLATLTARRFGQTSDQWYWWLAAIGACLLTLSFSFLEVRSQVGSQVFESAETAQEIGEIVNHSSQVVWVARYYGQPLQYNGELTGAHWPRRITYWLHQDVPKRELTIDQRMDALGFVPEYFVITDFYEFETNHADLKEYLADSCTLVAESDEYLIYNSCLLP